MTEAEKVDILVCSYDQVVEAPDLKYDGILPRKF